MEDDCTQALLGLLREEQVYIGDLRSALRDLIHTMENVQTSGGWSAVERAVSRARRTLNQVPETPSR